MVLRRQSDDILQNYKFPNELKNSNFREYSRKIILKNKNYRLVSKVFDKMIHIPMSIHLDKI